MVKNLLMILVSVMLVSGVSGQSFSFDPSADYEKSVSSTGYSSHILFMENLSGGELVLGWEMLSADLPPAWQADLCDYISCYIGIPEDGVMMAISDTTRGLACLCGMHWQVNYLA